MERRTASSQSRVRVFRHRVAAAWELLVHADDVVLEPHPNSRRFVAALPGADTAEAANSRRAARAFVADAEAGTVTDSSDYLRKVIEDLKPRS